MNFASRSTVAIGIVAMFAGIVPAAAASCTNASLSGNFGYSAQGNITKQAVASPYIGPSAEVGTASFSGTGIVTETATLSANGYFFSITGEGTYDLNANCTGTMVLNISPLGTTAHLNIVVDHGLLEMRAIDTDAGFIVNRLYTHY
jgi:hypothetical protein